MSKALDEIKRRALEDLQLREISDPGRNKKQNEKLARGMRDIPVDKMLREYQYLENELLPRMAKQRGKDNPDYKFFEGLLSTILYAVTVVDRYDYLSMSYTSQKVTMQLQHERIALIEGELQKFTTLEDLFLTDFLEKYAESVKQRLEAVLERQKKA